MTFLVGLFAITIAITFLCIFGEFLLFSAILLFWIWISYTIVTLIGSLILGLL